MNEKKVIFKNGDKISLDFSEEKKWNLSDYIRGGLELVFLI
tara:strand:- start:24 stop:146 length:123 start_codon:yes stop_codon:yes gene_type:complete